MMNDITSDELRAALAESFPERDRREHERAARIMAAEIEALQRADDAQRAGEA